MDGKRRWPRVPVRLNMTLKLADATVAVRSVNVSREGLFIAMDPPRRLGTEVRIKLEDSASGEQFELEGVVVHAVPDPDDPEHAGMREPRGIGVFLTSASAGWLHFCAGVAGDEAPQSIGPPSLAGAAVESEHEFDDAPPTERDLTAVPKRDDE